MEIINYISLGIGIGAVSVIGWGVLLGLVEFVKLEFQRTRGKHICHQREILRHHLGSYLLLGLEFLIAADIIRTITKPTLDEIAVLASIVAIRTILDFFLSREIASHSCPKD
ncbi:MAG TPA: DUF1622 domain-containing protein [Phycisphaerales bacterium]|nr:DUF1622 domain-containing protein [Phycisphaerales bacterium]